MDSLSFAAESLDLIWSEGAIYNIGFRKGLEVWRPFLKPGGVLAVSEITWLQPNPPEEILQHWNSEYPEIATAAEKIGTLEAAGYDLIGYFVLPASCWIDNYYEPTQVRVSAFLARHADKPEAAQVVELELQEAELYRRFQHWFSYGFYVARKR
jgi:SAM-dependent methyltransferase